MGNERPIPDRLGDQHEQAQHLTRTGNGPTVDDEQALLAAQHGMPDMAGYCTGPELAAPGADQDDAAEALVEVAAPAADDTENGGKSA
ncbi:hypothetical protein ACFVZR_02275 [Streptomyces sp. NPDC058316]|uniref:hypothetical protein n=1 Tax=Streptomyces sp. NPDC058316 TaxID=3346442 RepID=UPI0036F02876